MNSTEVDEWHTIKFISWELGVWGGACLQILAEACVSVPITCLSVEQYAIPTVENQCRQMGIPYLRMPPKELRLFLSQQEAKILLLSAHNSYIFPKEIVEKENFTIINFHNAYLPNYRGRNAPTWEIFTKKSLAEQLGIS